MSIPRLELLGVVIGCRISKYVNDQLGIDDGKRTIYTDSKCVLEWCKSQRELKRFVNERVKEIRSHVVKIGYVKSAENAADIATRGKTVSDLKNDKLWWHGPHWIADDKAE